MKKTIIYFLVIIFTVNLSLAQGGGLHNSGSKTSSNISSELIDKEIIKKLDRFFKKVIAEDINTGFEDLLVNSLIKNKKEDLSNLKKQTLLSVEIYGKIQGFEYVNAEEVTESFVRLRYLALHVNYPMRWVFTFYRSPEKGWIVSNIKLDDQSEYFFSD